MTTTLRSLLTADVHALGYNTTTLYTWFGDDEDRPTTTDDSPAYAGWSGLQNVTRDYRPHSTAAPLETLSGATHIAVPCTLWGDYIGGDVERSNARSLVRDLPGWFVVLSWSYPSAECLVLDLDREWDDEDASQLAELCRGLSDEYPLYDESDHSELTFEMSQEDWESWALSDAQSTYRDALVAVGVPEDVAHDDSGALSVTLTHAVEGWLSEGTVTYETESATSGVFRGLEEELRKLATVRGIAYLSS